MKKQQPTASNPRTTKRADKQQQKQPTAWLEVLAVDLAQKPQLEAMEVNALCL
jgi:hypothetical protein